MEIIGTNFALTLGSWRVKLCFAIEDADAPLPMKQSPPHRVRVVEDAYSRYGS